MKQTTEMKTNPEITDGARLVEAVARAMWNAKSEDDDSPMWEDLTRADEGLKKEIRGMAKVAIEEYVRNTR